MSASTLKVRSACRLTMPNSGPGLNVSGEWRMKMRKIRAPSKTRGWDDYARRHKVSPASRWILEGLKRITPALGVPRVAVDLGCGTGGGALALQAGGFEVHGVDISRLALSFARNRLREQEKRANRAGFSLPTVKRIAAVWQIARSRTVAFSWRFALLDSCDAQS